MADAGINIFLSYLRKNYKGAEDLVEELSDENCEDLLGLIETFPEWLQGKLYLAFLGTFRKLLEIRVKEEKLIEEFGIDRLFLFLFFKYLGDFPEGEYKQKLLRILGTKKEIKIKPDIDKHFVKTILVYFKRFYILNREYDSNIIETVDSLINNEKHLEIYLKVLQYDSIEFTFNANPYYSLEYTIDDLEQFKLNVEFIIRFLNYNQRGKYPLLNPMLGNLIDKLGRVIDLKKTTRLWDRYIFIYNEIGDNINNPTVLLSVADKVGKRFNVYATGTYTDHEKRSNIKSDYEEAKKLITSANLGSFPY